MYSGSVVFYKIATTCLLIFVGYIVRRMKLVPENSLAVMSKYTLNIALPSYIIFYMPSTISLDTLGNYWFFPVLAAVLLGATDVAGYGAARLWAKDGDIGTFRMMVALPNWIFMALAVCEPMFGAAGVRVVLLYNVGITFYIWSFGMTSFRSGMGWEVVKKLFLNIQTISTLGGLFLALAVPALRGMERLDATTLAAMPWHKGIIAPVWETVYLLGSTTLPLSIMQIGLFFGKSSEPAQASSTPEPKDTRSLAIIGVMRLIALPLLSIAMLCLFARLGIRLDRGEFMASAIVMAMPSAVMCISVAEVFGGNTRLAAKGIMWTTVASLATAPLLTMVADMAYGML